MLAAGFSFCWIARIYNEALLYKIKKMHYFYSAHNHCLSVWCTNCCLGTSPRGTAITGINVHTLQDVNLEGLKVTYLDGKTGDFKFLGTGTYHGLYSS